MCDSAILLFWTSTGGFDPTSAAQPLIPSVQVLPGDRDLIEGADSEELSQQPASRDLPCDRDSNEGADGQSSCSKQQVGIQEERIRIIVTSSGNRWMQWSGSFVSPSRGVSMSACTLAKRLVGYNEILIGLRVLRSQAGWMDRSEPRCTFLRSGL